MTAERAVLPGYPVDGTAGRGHADGCVRDR